MSVLEFNETALGNAGTASVAAPLSPAIRRARARRSAEVEYRLIAMLAYPVFFVIAALSFVLPRGLRQRLGAYAEGSLLSRMRALAATSIPFAFMG